MSQHPNVEAKLDDKDMTAIDKALAPPLQWCNGQRSRTYSSHASANTSGRQSWFTSFYSSLKGWRQVDVSWRGSEIPPPNPSLIKYLTTAVPNQAEVASVSEQVAASRIEWGSD